MRASWQIPYYDKKINLSTNICHDIYNINVNLDLSCYNDPYYSYKILSDFYNINIKNITIGLGLSELILRICQLIKNNNLSLTVLGSPTWQMVDLIKQTYNIKEGNDVLYIASPNGNTGNIEDIQHLTDKYKYIIIDESYADFYKKEINYSDNVIILKTLSKSYALPGARFGYAFASKEITLELQNLRPGHITIGNINTFLPFILNDMRFHIERMNETKDFLYMNGYCDKSFSNFVILKDSSIFNDSFILKNQRMSLTNLEIIKKCLKNR